MDFLTFSTDYYRQGGDCHDQQRVQLLSCPVWT